MEIVILPEPEPTPLPIAAIVSLTAPEVAQLKKLLTNRNHDLYKHNDGHPFYHALWLGLNETAPVTKPDIRDGDGDYWTWDIEKGVYKTNSGTSNTYENEDGVYARYGKWNG